MERSVVVFDTDVGRAKRALKELRCCAPKNHLSVRYTDGYPELLGMLRGEPMDMLIVDARANACGLDGIGIARKAAQQNAHVSVILSGIDEKNVARASLEDCICLLPTRWDAALFDDILKRAYKNSEQHAEKPFVVHTRRFERTIDPSEILFVESDRRKLRIHVTHEVIEMYGKMAEAKSRLPDRFIQCHKSFLVNLTYVIQAEANCLILTSGERIPISQARRKEVRQAFLEFQKQGIA